MEEEERIHIIKNEATKPKINKAKKQTESFSMKNNTSQNSKINNIQDNNINGNYGRIFIQEGQKKNLVYSEYDVPITSNTNQSNQLRDNKNAIKYNKYVKVGTNINTSNKIYSKKIDRNTENKIKGGRKGERKSSNLKRKSIERGGDYNNIQITHIIDSANNIDFHIIDPLVVVTEENKKKYRNTLNSSNRNGKNGKIKVVCSCSCEKIKIIPKKKKENIGVTQAITHRENPHLKRINANKTKKSNVGNSYSKISKIRSNRP